MEGLQAPDGPSDFDTGTTETHAEPAGTQARQEAAAGQAGAILEDRSPCTVVPVMPAAVIW